MDFGLVGWQIVVAYAASLLVYRIGSLMGLA